MDMMAMQIVAFCIGAAERWHIISSAARDDSSTAEAEQKHEWRAGFIRNIAVAFLAYDAANAAHGVVNFFFLFSVPLGHYYLGRLVADWTAKIAPTSRPPK
jgi:hypothetical protein